MRNALVLAAAAVLVATAAAPAKQVTRAEVCGSDGCQAIAHPDEQMLLGGNTYAGTPPGPAPFVRVVVAMDRGPAVRSFFVPRYGLVLDTDLRTWMHPPALAALRRAARTVTPIPAGRFPAGAFPAAPGTTSGGASGWWWALLAVPAAGLLALALRRRRGTDDRWAVYRWAGARLRRRPRGASQAR